MKQTIGILGGMGPLATCDLMEKIIELTNAPTDQENFRIVVDSNTEIPDRTAAILAGGASPVPELVKSAVRLQGMGADVIVMPCNTAHYFYDAITPYIDIPFINMIEETAARLQERKVKTAGLLATKGTIESGIYHKVMERRGIELLTPDAAGRDAMMELIYRGVKAIDADYQPDAARQTMERLMAQGAETLILGCTEIPIGVKKYGLQFPFIDASLVLAQAAIDFFKQND